jgi:ornithine cyclodeaminase/alanine dehydrogenase-like protein (mu-crystallin family)
MMNIVVLNHKQVTKLLPMPECINVMAEVLAAVAKKEAYQPLRTIIRPEGAKGVMATMPSYIYGERAAYGLKEVCVFPNNPNIGKDAHQGSVLLHSAETGELLAVMNASSITAIRTGAVSGVATRLLAREDAGDLAIIGAGVQARSHLAAMATVRPIQRVRVTDKLPGLAQKFADEMSVKYEFPIEAVDNNEDAVRGADIIVTVTSTMEPVLRRDWIEDGAHLNVVGSCFPHCREVDTETMVASRLFVDRRESTLNEAGDYLIAAKEGAIGPEHILADIGEILIGDAKGRASDGEITLFKALGLAVEDLAAAEYIYRQAKEQKFGNWMEF